MTLIPHVVPIPNLDSNDHIRTTSDNLPLLLANKKSPIGPFIEETTKEAMIRLARILGHDATPKTPVLSIYESVVSNKTVDATSENVSKQNTIPYAPI